jgi:hypothetical protein
MHVAVTCLPAKVATLNDMRCCILEQSGDAHSSCPSNDHCMCFDASLSCIISAWCWLVSMLEDMRRFILEHTPVCAQLMPNQ